ncbi:MAG: DUF1295 domain-containing protein [Bryobacteraceae bacterium]
MTALGLIVLGAIAVGTLMFVLWLMHFPIRNAAIVDAGWAGGLALLAILYAQYGDGDFFRSWIMAAMVSFWGFRLAGYLLLTRVVGHPEEGRYVELRRKWKTHIGLRFLIFFELQALLCVLLSVPFLLAATNPAPGIGGLERSAMLLFVLAVLGESLADAQLNAFKRNLANKGKTCRAGLWKYSRHPNYFFEWLIWMAFALFGLSAPLGWLGFLSPALILLFLFRVTGIPATEAQALRSRGDEYREYQRTTSAFVPWFPKS